MEPVAFKTQFDFEPAPAAVSVAAAATPYTTPATWQESLDDLARLTYIKAAWRYDVRLNQNSTTGAATLNLKANGAVIDSVALDLTSGQRFTASRDVDLSSVKGASQIEVELVVGTAGDAGTTAQVFSRLDLTFPMMVLGC